MLPTKLNPLGIDNNKKTLEFEKGGNLVNITGQTNIPAKPVYRLI